MDKVKQLVIELIRYNDAYRSGSPIVSDREYDEYLEKLRELDPDNDFLKHVESEVFAGKKKVRHPSPMLSMDKAYNRNQVQKFLDRVEKEAEKLHIPSVTYKVMPKLDGLAGRDDGSAFASRGNGEEGYEISSAFEKGVFPVGGRGQGVGEIVVVKSYFEEKLSGLFEHPRNMVVGIVSSDSLRAEVKEALSEGMIRFVPYSSLDSWEGGGDVLIDHLDDIIVQLTDVTDYPMDGVVVECVDDRVKLSMGATTHHHRWQIAVKSKGETCVTIVESLKWQVGRGGSVTPVIQVKPVAVSGATIRRVTAHHAGLVKRKRIGIGAEIEIIRSGEVIPKLERVLVPSDDMHIPQDCPSCKTKLRWNNDFLKCDNSLCPAKIEQFLHHWFKTIGTAEWFGIKTIQRLVNAGYDSLEKIYEMSLENYSSLGFGPVQSKNLHDALLSSITREIDDWRFIAAFGISNLGVGDSRKLLSFMNIESMLEVSSKEDIKIIKGFGDITSQRIVDGILYLKNTIQYFLSRGIPLKHTKPINDAMKEKGILFDQYVVFTGKLMKGARHAMEEEARSLGAIIQSSVNSRTNYLVCGEKVGSVKIQKAKKMGALILSEEEYIKMISR